MFENNNLEKAVGKFLNEQAKLDEKKNKIIDLFNEKYPKEDVESIVEFLLQISANIYHEDIEKFATHYISSNKDDLTVKDIKVFITLQKVYKSQMKEPNSPNDKGDYNKQNIQEKNNAEEEDE